MFKRSFLLFPGLVSLCVFCSTLGQASPVEIPQNKPVIYLTFDDGPSSDQVTERILEVLAEHDAKATFFVTGLRARANPEKIAKIYSAGHALGNHAYSHRDLTKLTDHRVDEEFSSTNKYLYDAGAPTINCFRAPFGVTNKRVKAIAGEMGMRSVGWNIDTRDWDERVDPEHLSVQLEDSYHESIVLMHDGPRLRWRTLAVFTRWMEDAGDIYDFKVLPECVQPMTETFAALDPPTTLPQETKPQLALVPEELVAEPVTEPLSIEELLGKLAAYEFSLDPEVVAQNESQ